MKTTKLFIAIVAFVTLNFELETLNCFAQSNNLYFNQIINQAVNATPTCYTVPAGKVFKLEGVTATSSGIDLYIGSACGGTQYGGMNMTDNNMNIGVITSAGDFFAWPFPMWFKAGVSFSASAGTIYISGIEFNSAP